MPRDPRQNVTTLAALDIIILEAGVISASNHTTRQHIEFCECRTCRRDRTAEHNQQAL